MTEKMSRYKSHRARRVGRVGPTIGTKSLHQYSSGPSIVSVLPAIVPVDRMAQMETTSSGSMRSSAGCRHSADIPFFSSILRRMGKNKALARRYFRLAHNGAAGTTTAPDDL